MVGIQLPKSLGKSFLSWTSKNLAALAIPSCLLLLALEMSQSALKRKRPGTNPPPLSIDDQRILDLIRSKEGFGMPRREIKYLSKLPETAINKSLKSLTAKNLIQEVKPKNSGAKVYMGAGFTPSNEVSGGFWYNEGSSTPNSLSSSKNSASSTSECIRLLLRRGSTGSCTRAKW